MIKENIVERVQVEKEIRESFRSQTGAPGAPTVLANPNPARSNLRMNLTGEDNFERLSSISRSSSFYGGTSPMDTSGTHALASVFGHSSAIPIPSVSTSSSATLNPMNNRVVSGSYRSEAISSATSVSRAAPTFSVNSATTEVKEGEGEQGDK